MIKFDFSESVQLTRESQQLPVGLESWTPPPSQDVSSVVASSRTSTLKPTPPGIYGHLKMVTPRLLPVSGGEGPIRGQPIGRTLAPFLWNMTQQKDLTSRGGTQRFSVKRRQ